LSVKTLIDELLPYCPGYNRSGVRGLLKLIQKAQDELFDFDGPMMQWVGTDNQGWPTYLKTVAGTYRYDMLAANMSAGSIIMVMNGVTYNVRCRKVLKIFVDSTKTGYNQVWIGQPYLFSWQNPYSTVSTRINVADIAVNSTQALENTPASVTFQQDPGTQDAMYFVKFLWEPPRLDSEQVPLCIPKIYESALEDYVIGKIQTRQNGKMSERMMTFLNFWVPKFRKEVTTGANLIQHETAPRIC
jgi:hypothetical protein